MKAQSTKKHVTPKWADRLLVGVLILMPVLYIAGLNVNYGPSMSLLGWFYRTSWGEQPTRVGQIVRFAQPGQPTWRKYILPSIKRVADIRKDGYYVEGDNTERSQDSRDWGKVVPSDHVAGVVVWCWSPARAWRGRTAEGRLRNQMQFLSVGVVQENERFIITRNPVYIADKYALTVKRIADFSVGMPDSAGNLHCLTREWIAGGRMGLLNVNNGSFGMEPLAVEGLAALPVQDLFRRRSLNKRITVLTLPWDDTAGSVVSRRPSEQCVILPGAYLEVRFTRPISCTKVLVMLTPVRDTSKYRIEVWEGCWRATTPTVSPVIRAAEDESELTQLDVVSARAFGAVRISNMSSDLALNVQRVIP